MSTDRKAIAYLRVSTEEQGQSGLGLEAQDAIVRDYCDRTGLDLIEIVAEVQSGKSTKKRPLLAGALDRLAKGEAHVLVASNVSRLARSVSDLSQMLETATKKGYGVATIDTGLDTTTPAGKMVFQMLGVAAEYERAMISDRTKKALGAKKARGETLGRPVAMSEATRSEIVTMAESGLSLNAIARYLTATGTPTAHGGAKWHPSTISKALAYYRGLEAVARSLERVA